MTAVKRNAQNKKRSSRYFLATARTFNATSKIGAFIDLAAGAIDKDSGLYLTTRNGTHRFGMNHQCKAGKKYVCNGISCTK